MGPRFKDHPQHINSMIAAALSAAAPAAAVRRSLQRQGTKLIVGENAFDLDSGRVFLVGVGKAAIAMSETAADILDSFLFQGVIISKQEDSESTGGKILPREAKSWSNRMLYFQAGHPVSNEDSLTATAAVIEMLRQTNEDDLVLCLISGGTSALLTQPRIPLSEWQELVGALLGSGCSINELNAVRKQLDPVKGGGLARIASPASCLSLILSDVVGNPLDIIGSGPTVPLEGHTLTAHRILTRYDIPQKLSPKVWQTVEQELLIAKRRTSAKSIDAINLIIGDVRQAALAAVAAAREAGFEAQLLTAHLEGEARQIGLVGGALAKDMPLNSCRVLGGETTVTIQGDGIGSRNLEIALSAAISVAGWDDIAIATLATDGDDGPAKVAGAIVTGLTVAQARKKGIYPIEFLDRNDSFHFFELIGGLIDTGPTGTNVNDLLILLRYAN